LNTGTLRKESLVLVEGVVVLLPLGNHSVAPHALYMIQAVQIVEASLGQSLRRDVGILEGRWYELFNLAG